MCGEGCLLQTGTRPKPRVLTRYSLRPLNFLQQCMALPGAPLSGGLDQTTLGEEHECQRHLNRPARADHGRRLLRLVPQPQQRQVAGRVRGEHRHDGDVEYLGGRVLPQSRAPPTAAGERRGGGRSDEISEHASTYSATLCSETQACSWPKNREDSGTEIHTSYDTRR